MELKQHFLNAFGDAVLLEKTKSLQEQSFSIFSENGFPNTKNEEWKYTNLRDVAEFVPNTSLAKSVDSSTLAQFQIPGLDTYTVVLVDGFFKPELSDLPKTTEISSLRAALSSNADALQHFGSLLKVSNESLSALNTAFLNDGIYLNLAAGKVEGKPIHIIHINTGAQIGQPRSLFQVGRNAELKVISSHHNLSGSELFENCAEEIFIGANAELEYVKLQTECDQLMQICSIEIAQEQDSRFLGTTLTWSGKLVRNNLNAIHKGKNCTTNFYGLYLAGSGMHIDNHTLMDHAVPNCQSNELYKGVLTGNGRAVFNGKVMVRPDAQKTNAYQSNANILLSPSATINAKPQLEIFADDVKCSHGATVGQLDPNELFYMRARGIDEESARKLLLQAFAADVINHISMETLADYLVEQLANRLQNLN